MASRLGQFFIALFVIAMVLTIAITLENKIGIPIALTLRIICASVCLYVMYKIGSDYPGQKWPRVALALAVVFNFAMFFSPLAKLPASKGDIMFFAVPDAVIFLAARTFTYPAFDTHQRAVRQQLIVGFILALAVCAILMSILLIPEPPAHR
ncbi:hypothetical protein [Sphingomonas lycopersici]|uniref:Uncharacterized protein n=1 Tax=Sphingomonas lycopersici TaxID=2951807 RepID=A0AA41ZBK4_9SPHN|nr:hypothetical protein [Sphingomonas lycopersici]MCW6536292.1 hypothetical protein [Sphingomonas lycopersici]